MSRSRTTADSGEGWKGMSRRAGLATKELHPRVLATSLTSCGKLRALGHHGRRMIGTCRSFRSPQKSLLSRLASQGLGGCL